MARFKEKIEARSLRRKGESIKEIARKLGVSVSSVSLWCRDIQLTSRQIVELEKRSKDPYYGKRLVYLMSVQKKTKEKIRKLKKAGIVEVGSLSRRELFLVGAALYWAEGFKKDSQAGFASSDPAMVNIFVRWLEECCGYSRDNLSMRVTVNISHKHRVSEIEKYWAEATGISVNSFQKPYFQKVKWKKVYENPNEYFGVLRVRVRKSTDFLRKIHGWIEGLKLQV